MKNGEIWLFDFGGFRGSVQGGVRPALVISTVDSSPVCTVIPATTRIRGMSCHVPITLDRPSELQCEQIQTVDKCTAIRFLQRFSATDMQNVKQCLFKLLNNQ